MREKGDWDAICLRQGCKRINTSADGATLAGLRRSRFRPLSCMVDMIAAPRLIAGHTCRGSSSDPCPEREDPNTAPHRLTPSGYSYIGQLRWARL